MATSTSRSSSLNGTVGRSSTAGTSSTAGRSGAAGSSGTVGRNRDVRRNWPFAVVAAGVLGAAAVASAVNVAVAAVAHGLGVSDQIVMLSAHALIAFTVLGVVIGGIGWAIIARRAARPASLLSWLVPTVLALSMVPDVLLRTTHQPHVTVGAVAALILAHLATGAIAVAAYLRVMPVRESR